MAQPKIPWRIARLFRLVFLASFCCCLLVSIGFAIRTALFTRNAARASAEVVRLNERFSENNDDAEFAPVFQFVAENGKSYTVTSSTATSPPSFTVGEKVQVLYRKSDPGGAEIDSLWQLWLVPIILVAIGLSHGVIGSILWLLERRQDRRTLPVSRQAV
jgi:hypothetical protein